MKLSAAILILFALCVTMSTAVNLQSYAATLANEEKEEHKKSAHDAHDKKKKHHESFWDKVKHDGEELMKNKEVREIVKKGAEAAADYVGVPNSVVKKVEDVVGKE